MWQALALQRAMSKIARVVLQREPRHFAHDLSVIARLLGGAAASGHRGSGLCGIHFQRHTVCDRYLRCGLRSERTGASL